MHQGVIHYIETHISGNIEEDIVSLVVDAFSKLVKDYFVTTHTVHEWIWGYEDQMLKDLDVAIKDVNHVFSRFHIHIHIPEPSDFVAFQVCLC